MGVTQHPKTTPRIQERTRRLPRPLRTLGCPTDFIVGLIGKQLYPLSSIVQTMRKTQQTALYLERLGPFFVGRALWQSPE